MENNVNGDRDLDQDSLVEILVRMPVYCVFRLKCVSKRWNSIISEPTFAGTYVSHATKASTFSRRSLLLFDPHNQDVQMGFGDIFPPHADSMLHRFIRDEVPLRVESEDQVQPLSTGTLIYLPPTSVKQYNVNVIAASSGLFLLSTDDLYYVYNIVTRENIAIAPPANHMVSTFFVGFITQMEGPLVKCFRIVKIRKQTNELVFRVYSSEDATWAEQGFTKGPVDTWDARIHFAFNGHLHWVDCRAGIIAYDPFNNKCRLLSFPNSGSVKGFDVCFSVSKEHIRLVQTPKLEADFAEEIWICTIWRLKDYDKVEWCLEHKITRDWRCIGITRPSILIPLLSDPDDPEVVYLCRSVLGQVIYFNLRTKKVCIDYKWEPFSLQFMIKGILPVEIPIWPSPIPGPQLPRSL